MDAFQAAELTKQYLRSSVIIPHVDVIVAEIRRMAELGKFSIGNLWQVAKVYDYDTQNAIKVHFRKLDFAVTDHEDPDPGDQRSGPYTTLSW